MQNNNKMLQAIFYKEWLKIRKIVALGTIISLVFVVYAQIRIGRVVELKGVAHLWEVMLMKSTVFIELLRYIPLALGVAFSLAQFIPEMLQKRLKLTLHLPLRQGKVVAAMLTCGLACLFMLFVLHYLALFLYLRVFLAAEFVSRILLTALVWYVAGIAAYLLTSWICLEPTWRRRIANTLFAVAFIRLFFIVETPEAYNTTLWMLVVATLLFTGLPYLSVVRFKEGRQD